MKKSLILVFVFVDVLGFGLILPLLPYYAETFDATPTYVHAELRTMGIGYVDDVERCFDQEAPVIHFRSSARLPYFDWGVNRKRMEEIHTAFKAGER